jgi:16S rRNA (cytosine1402-N4)-methyltransferase
LVSLIQTTSFTKMDNPKPNKARRVRYSGSHPKAFQEKYKELQPENYAIDIEKIKLQGRTPAGMHRSICVQEIVDFLQIQSGQMGLDATLGYGGHSLELLQKLQPNGFLYATDVDSIELPKTKLRLQNLGFGDDKIAIRKMNFSNIQQLVSEAGKFDFILADLGVSSMQIDNPTRGFSFKLDGPLDLRLNPNTGKSAASFLQKISCNALEQLLITNADEPNANIISNAITHTIKGGVEIKTTGQLKEIIANALHFLPAISAKDEIKKTCQRCFQALRIAVNDEFGVLDKFLERLPSALKPGGRVAILSFHSGEDRRVKKSFQHFFREGLYKEISTDFIKASAKECFDNPRAKSAKLRWAIMG